MDEKRERWLKQVRDYQRKRRTDPEFRERERVAKLARRAARREWLRGIKAERGCRVCEEHDPVVLDFHHRNPDEKVASPLEMVAKAYGLARIKAEIAKCDVLCANCHRRAHHEEELRRNTTERSVRDLSGG